MLEIRRAQLIPHWNSLAWKYRLFSYWCLTSLFRIFSAMSDIWWRKTKYSGTTTDTSLWLESNSHTSHIYIDHM